MNNLKLKKLKESRALLKINLGLDKPKMCKSDHKTLNLQTKVYKYNMCLDIEALTVETM